MKTTDIKNVNSNEDDSLQVQGSKNDEAKEQKRDPNQAEVEPKTHRKDESEEQPIAEPVKGESKGEPKKNQETPKL